MATPWQNVLVAVPPDGTTVWIVRLPFFDVPVQATYDANLQVFFYTDTNTITANVPFYVVFKWRPI